MIFKFKLLSEKDGFSLFEVMASIAILVVCLVPMLISFSGHVRMSTRTKNFISAEHYAVEALERARENAHYNWSSISEYDFEDVPGTGGKFRRRLYFGAIPSDYRTPHASTNFKRLVIDIAWTDMDPYDTITVSTIVADLR